MSKSLKLFMALALTGALTLSAEEHLKSLNPAYFDKSTPASVDFYKHVNKGWQDAHPLTVYGRVKIDKQFYIAGICRTQVVGIVLEVGGVRWERVLKPANPDK